MTFPQKSRNRRLAWILQNHQDSLLQALARDRSATAKGLQRLPEIDRGISLLEMICDRADPTKNKKFTPWLGREYAAGRLLVEDLGSANATLTLFMRYAPRLTPEQRDIQRYGSLAAAWEVVRGFAQRDEVHSNKAQRALDRAKAYEESRILRQDPDGFTVAVPMTEFAAKWWGRGTRWCTSAEDNNAFRDYHEEAPLIVIIIPGVGKFQMWVTQDESFLMDARDTQISEEILTAHWPRFLPLFRFAVTLNGYALELVPEELRDEDLCKSAVLEYPSALNSVPQRLKTFEFLHSFVIKNGKILRFIPHMSRTYDLCLAAVQQDGSALQWVPEDQLTYDLCYAAVQQDGSALEWVPYEHRTCDLCHAAVTAEPTALNFVPDQIKSFEMCQSAVRRTPSAFAFTPEGLRSPDLWLDAIQQNGSLLSLLKPEELTFSLCQAAVENHAVALRYVPLKFRTREICQLAILAPEGIVRLSDIPQDYHDEEIFLGLITRHGLTLDRVPHALRTCDLYRKAVLQNGLALKHVPPPLRRMGICLDAVAQNGAALEYVPEELQTDELLRVALQQNSLALGFIPRDRRSLELCRIAAQNNWTEVLDLVPSRHKTQEFYQFLVDSYYPTREFEGLDDARSVLSEMVPQFYIDKLRLKFKPGVDVPAWAPILEAWRANLYPSSVPGVVSNVYTS